MITRVICLYIVDPFLISLLTRHQISSRMLYEITWSMRVSLPRDMMIYHVTSTLRYRLHHVTLSAIPLDMWKFRACERTHYVMCWYITWTSTSIMCFTLNHAASNLILKRKIAFTHTGIPTILTCEEWFWPDSIKICHFRGRCYLRQSPPLWDRITRESFPYQNIC